MRKFHKRYDFIIKIISEFYDLNGKTVIDCACGEGDGSRMFLKYSCNVLGIDLDKKKILLARKIIKKVKFLNNSIVYLDVKDNYADIFVCSETLEHLDAKDNIKAVNEIKRVTKDHGFICVTVPSNKNVCLKNKFHKQYLTFENIINFFRDCKYLKSEIFLKNILNPARGNLVVILQNLK